MPKRRLMWENASDTRHELVANAMRRDKFEAILTKFYFADNNCLVDADKFSKVRPLVKHLNQKFLEHTPVEEFYSFDESMCEYYGVTVANISLGANQHVVVSRFGVLLLL